MALQITDDIDALIDVLPADIVQSFRRQHHDGTLLEIILDLGRVCEARYAEGEVELGSREIEQEDIDHVVSQIGAFGDDNRAGIERTLHRISAIRNRQGSIIGLTCRVGRAVYGTMKIIRDVVESGRSILLLGRPGVGKTTMLREVARVLAEEKRVVIVDTSNEIGGDGDIPHPAIGKARRMQVPTPSMQHAVMIEAVENHMPEVIVIDEIGTELEAAAARTIAERGVQLVGTAHGNTLDNLLMNPTLCDLVGGIHTVTLSDEEARRRGTQKTVLERKAPPTFQIVVEIQDWDRVAVRRDVSAAVDYILRGRSLPAEIRVRKESGSYEERQEVVDRQEVNRNARKRLRRRQAEHLETLHVYPYGLNRNRLKQASQHLRLPVILVDELIEADALFTLRVYYRKHPKVIERAERRGVPIYVLRNNTVVQMEKYLAEIFELARTRDDDVMDSAHDTVHDTIAKVALEDAQRAIQQILAGERKSVQLASQGSRLRKMQHELAREANLTSRSSGSEPSRRVTIYANR